MSDHYTIFHPRLSFLMLRLSFYDMTMSDLEFNCWVKQYKLLDDQSFNEEQEIDVWYLKNQYLSKENAWRSLKNERWGLITKTWSDVLEHIINLK